MSVDPEKTTAYERWELPNVGPVVGATQKIPSGPLTAAQIEAMQAQAYEEAAADGYQAGFERGLGEGETAARQAVEETLARLRTLIDHLAEPLSAVNEMVEACLVTLSLSVARQLVRRELKADPGEIVAAVREAMAALPIAHRDVRLRLHPDDASLVREALAIDGAESSWRVIEDPLITRGGCRVEAGDSSVDASVENRMTTAIANVLGGERDDDEAS